MFVSVIKILQYNKIDVSEGIGIKKISKSKEYMLFHYWYFKDVGYKFQPHLCNDFHAVSIMSFEVKKHCNIKYKRC